MLIKRRKHIVPELNTTSTADISFMLLTFFLVTTSMDVDRGLVRQLPPMDNEREEQLDPAEVSRDNTLAFRITASGELLMNDSPVAADGLRRRIADFIRRRPMAHVIYVDADPASGYDAYFRLEDEIVAAYNSVRDDVARKKFGRPYAALAEAQRNKVRDLCPQHISETYNSPAQGTAADADAATPDGEKKKGGAR